MPCETSQLSSAHIWTCEHTEPLSATAQIVAQCDVTNADTLTLHWLQFCGGKWQHIVSSRNSINHWEFNEWPDTAVFAALFYAWLNGLNVNEPIVLLVQSGLQGIKQRCHRISDSFFLFCRKNYCTRFETEHKTTNMCDISLDTCSLRETEQKTKRTRAKHNKGHIK